MLPKFFLSIAALLFVVQCRATNYYFSAVSGNDTYTSTQAQNKATPWQSIAKLNSYAASIKPGDSILFKCGETFPGSITLTKSGTAALPVIVASYGTGARPIISGLVPTSTWTNMGNGIWETSCPAAGTTVNVVMLNGVAQAIGRYPNATAPNGGFLNIDSFTGDTQIVSSALNTSLNWAGADIVIRKNHWTIDKATVTSNTATAVNYTETSVYTPTANWGFFLQNSPNALDLPGEWCYIPATRMIMMYFGSVTPIAGSVQASGVNYLVNLSSVNYVTIQNLEFLGSNSSAINLFTCYGFKLSHCTIISSGINAVYGNVTRGLTVSNCNIQNTNSCGIVSRNQQSSVITNDTLINTGLIPGMGQTNDGASYEGIICTEGKSALIANNSLVNIGYNGIDFGGDSTVIKNNYVTNFEQLKDDGGAIYTYAGDLDSNTNHVGIMVTNNVLTTTVGAPAGSTGTFPGCASGIYMDDNTTGLTITGNSISSCITGVYFHHARNIIMQNNTLFNNLTGILFTHNETKYVIKNNVVNNNIIYSLYKTEPVLSLQSIDNDLTRFATFTGNYYSPTIDNVFAYNAAGKLLDFSLWQYLYGKDLTSTITPSFPYYTLAMSEKRSFFTNSAFNSNIKGATSWSVDGNFVAAWNASGELDGGSLKGSFTYNSGSAGNSPILLYTVGAVSTTAVYMVKFSMIATSGHKRLRVYIRNGGSPYNQISETKYVDIDSTRTENTLMIVPTVTVPNAQVVLALEDETISIYIDNFGFYTTNSTANDPTANVVYKYNATSSTVNAKLNAQYVDVYNTLYKGTVTIPAMSSVLLFKKLDTVVTKPPVIYDAPNATNDIATLIPIKSVASIGVYPNPATEYIVLNFSNTTVKALNIKLVDSQGAVIINQNVEVADNSYRLNFSQKPRPGKYFIQMSGTGINQTSKVIIM